MLAYLHCTPMHGGINPKKGKSIFSNRVGRKAKLKMELYTASHYVIP
jgi:hypothetical protein